MLIVVAILAAPVQAITVEHLAVTPVGAADATRTYSSDAADGTPGAILFLGTIYALSDMPAASATAVPSGGAIQVFQVAGVQVGRQDAQLVPVAAAAAALIIVWLLWRRHKRKGKAE